MSSVSKIICASAAGGAVLSFMGGCTINTGMMKPLTDPDGQDLFNAFNDLRGYYPTVWEDFDNQRDADGSCNSPPEWAEDNDSMCEDEMAKFYGSDFRPWEANGESCCALAVKDSAEGGLEACEQGNFGKNQCQKSCWTKLELTRVKCTIDNWDTLCSGSTCTGVDNADATGGACWALYEFNALLESCVDNGSLTSSDKTKLWDGVKALPGGFNQQQINCLTGSGGNNVVQRRKQQALPAIIDNALNCPSTQSLVRFLGALETIKETQPYLVEGLFNYISFNIYGFNVWDTFFSTGGIVDKLAQSMCTNGLENVCSV